MNLSNLAHLLDLNIYENYVVLVIKWHYKKTEGIYFVPGIEYSKAKKAINPAYQNDQQKALGEYQENAQMHDNVWWLIWNRTDITNALTASIRYR